MPRDKRDPAARKPSPYEGAGSAGINGMVERVAPSILGLLADGRPRTKPAIVAALAGRHDKQNVVHALIRLAVTHARDGRRGSLSALPVQDHERAPVDAKF